MASTFLTVAKPFTSLSNQRQLGARRNPLRISAIATKLEPTKVAPQADRVLIRLEELPQKSAGGVLLPKSAVKYERYLLGEVLSVGAEVKQVEAGKKVLFSDLNAYECAMSSIFWKFARQGASVVSMLCSVSVSVSMLLSQQRIKQLLQRLPGLLQRFPGRLKRLPGMLPRLPGQLQRLPGLLQRLQRLLRQLLR